MQKVKNLLSLSVAAMSIAALSSCSDEDFGYTSADIAYKHNFEKAFGKVDPNQDWNLVAQLAQGRAATRAAGSKTTPTGDFNISVLPDNQAAIITPELMKDYSKMLPESNKSNAPYAETNLGRVTQNFSVTTSKVILYPVYWWTDNMDEIGIYYYSDEAGSVSVNVNGGGSEKIVRIPVTTSKPEELEYFYEAAAQWTQIYDYNYATYLPADYQTQLVNQNLGFKITDGTEYSEYGELTVEAGKFMKVGKKTLGYKTPAAEANVEFECVFAPQPLDVMTAMAELYPEKYKVNGSNDYGYCASAAGNRYASVISNSDCAIKVDPAINAATSTDPEVVINGNIKPTGFRSKGIVVELPSSMKIGFYLMHPNGTYVYSEGKFNGYMRWDGHKTEDNCFVATYQSDEVDANGQPVRYLAFEDWVGEYGDYDLNDAVFRVYGFEEINDEEETTEEGLLVCEDLGNFDFDFNDVVLKLKWSKHVKKTYNKDQDGNVTSVTINGEEQTFTITPMAAGGEYESTVKYNNQTIGEIHNLLAGNAPSIINAGETFGGEGLATNYVLDNSTWNSTSYPNGYVSQVFGEGLITIAVENGTTAERLINSTNYNTKGVPQMMLLPVSFEWPQENQEISTVYTGFTNWVSDATATDWISNHTNKVTKR